MTRSRPFAQVDVFGAEAYAGNPVAVALDAQGLGDAEMAQFARWTNLSETTFVLPPTTDRADYRLRIFSPGGEIPFGGHPTLGSAHAWLEAGGRARSDDVVVQECGAGLVPVRRSGGALAFSAPPRLRTGPLDDDLLGRVAGGLGIDRSDVVAHEWIDNGPGWVAVQLASAAEVLALEPDAAGMAGLMLGVVGAHPPDSPHDFEVRVFAAPAGVGEDPVSGSVNAAIGQWLIGTGTAPPRYTVSQGARTGRRGVVTVEAADGAVWVGGRTVTCVRGEVDL